MGLGVWYNIYIGLLGYGVGCLKTQWLQGWGIVDCFGGVGGYKREWPRRVIGGGGKARQGL